MNLQGIISISGKAGLFKVIAQGKNNIIVESLEDGKRFPAFASDQISALDDISIYTFDDDVPLKEVYQTMFEKYEGKVGPKFKSPLKELRAEFLEILPEYDEDRVHDSDIKKTKDVLMQVLTSHPKVLNTPAPTVNVSELADSSVNFAVRPWCNTEHYWDVYFDVTEHVKEALDAAGIEIPYPHQVEIHKES